MSQAVEVEKTYRKLFRFLSIEESKLHSTPIFEGELALYKKNFKKFFPEDVGADDTAAAFEIKKRTSRDCST